MAKKRTRGQKVKRPVSGLFTCGNCGAAYWYPREFAHRDHAVHMVRYCENPALYLAQRDGGVRYIKNPDLCDACLAEKRRRSQMKDAGCIVDFDGEWDGLMSLEDDEKQTPNGQMLLF
jgi:hypothetical protein